MDLINLDGRKDQYTGQGFSGVSNGVKDNFSNTSHKITAQIMIEIAQPRRQLQCAACFI